MPWHYENKTPAPYLVMTGLSYLFPAMVAYSNGFIWETFSLFFVTGTTMAFHWFRDDTLFVIDVVAILNLFTCALYNASLVGVGPATPFIGSILYCFYSYFLGQQFKTLAWDPDWTTQMIFHGFIHISTAYGAYKMLITRTHSTDSLETV